jgi:hypothetical protein
MRWLQRKREEAALQKSALSDNQLLVEEIRIAHAEWQVAQMRFDYVVEPDQIDYCIYALEAAEKRYEMLLKQAKRTNARAYDIPSTQAVGR